MSFPGGSDGKESAWQCGRAGFDPWVGKIPWKGEWLPSPVFLPAEFNGQRSLAGSNLWGCKESNTTEQLTCVCVLGHFSYEWLFATLWDCSPPGSSVQGILQARILEWVAISFSRGSSRPRDWTWVSRIVGRRFTLWAIREALNKHSDNIYRWCTLFQIWNQSVVPCPVLIVASSPEYRFIKRQVMWFGNPISFRIFHSLLWSTQSKALA